MLSPQAVCRSRNMGVKHPDFIVIKDSVFIV